MVTILGQIEPATVGWLVSLASIALATIAMLSMVSSWRRVRETTLLPTWCWTLLSLWLVSGAAIARSLSHVDAPWTRPMQLIAAAATFCPAMATMGARRPHLGVWQFVVLSLWGIIALPALENLLVHPDRPLTMHPAREWFLLILTVISAVNMLPTRYWLTALLWAGGQAFLLAEYLPLLKVTELGHPVLVGLGLCSTATALAGLGLWPARRAETSQDRLWIEFRDLYGAVWGLRVAEQFNALSSRKSWGWKLTWNGFRAQTDSGQEEFFPETDRDSLRQVIENLFRRFVTSQWIAARLDQNVD